MVLKNEHLQVNVYSFPLRQQTSPKNTTCHGKRQDPPSRQKSLTLSSHPGQNTDLQRAPWRHSKKISKRNCMMRKIAGTSRGAKQTVLRATGMPLCYSVEEYCAPVWSRSAPSKLVGVKLRETMRIVSGCLKSTPKEWLPVCSAIWSLPTWDAMKSTRDGKRK